MVFHGTIPAIDVAEALSRTEILIAPSLEEMFGNQFIEAAAVGADAIVTEGTALAENARNLVVGKIAAKNNAADLARQICASLDEKRPLSSRAQGRQKVIELFGPGIVAASHLRVYRQIGLRQ